jgi:murein DD-endopeptidase MepM/ murein hydrolase activator NlpD
MKNVLMKKLCLLLFLITFCNFAQYPSNYFRSPLDIPINLSGTFGELRPNHFHAGLDIRTNNVEGLPVYAVADGYISRIKISTYGYGKALYITHENGYTSVYGHLQRLNDKIQEYAISNQYSQKSYEMETYPGPSLSVKKGDIIAYSGNTGGSGGPHLHFEFRDTKTENIINPMYFGMNKLIKDVTDPEVHSIMAYALNDSTTVNKSRIPIGLNLVKQADGTYLTNKVYANGRIGFGINTTDVSTNNYNKNGIFSIETFVNGVRYFDFKFDTFSFEESKYINYFIDYKRYKQFKQRFQKLFIKEYYPLSILTHNKKSGFLNVKPNSSFNYKIVIADFHGNKRTINIPVEYRKDEIEVPVKVEGKYLVKAKSEHNFEFETSNLYLPENAFYENFYLNASEKNGILNIENNYEGIKSGFVVSFDIKNLTPEEQKKSFIASVNGYKVEYNSSYKTKDKISAKVKSFGLYKLASDTTPPRIYNPNFIEGSNIIGQKTLSIQISDALSGIDTYNAYLNNEWILMEYDHKTKKLIHNLKDGKVSKGENIFKLTVTDKLENTTTFTSSFTYE